jgi:hypothetical protein
VFLATALICGQACDSAAPAADEQDLPIAADGVKYASREVRDLMEIPAVSHNLLANGSFEKGRYWPEAWDPADRLGTFWAEPGSQGRRCIRLDTNLIDTQWVEWNEKVLALVKDASERTGRRPQSLEADPVPNPPPRQPTHPPYYDTVAGIHGIHYRSEFFPAKPGAVYRFSVDARASVQGEPKVFIKAFVDERRRVEEGESVLKRNAYRAPMTLYGCGPEWKRFAFILHPTQRKTASIPNPLQPQWLRVELYAYWPVGTYEFDNARIEIVGYDAVETVPQSSPQQKDDKPQKPQEQDRFPVFGQ